MLAPDPVAPWSNKSCRILPFLAHTVQHLYLRQTVDSCGAIYQKQPLCTVQWCQTLFMWLNVPEKAFYGANPESCGTLYLRRPVEWCVSWILWHPVPETACRMVPILAPVAPCTLDASPDSLAHRAPTELVFTVHEQKSRVIFTLRSIEECLLPR